jgi:hypothetical protein
MTWVITGSQTSFVWTDAVVPILPSCTTRYTLTVGNDGNGSVTLNPPGGSYCSGRTVTLTPVPNTSYYFSYWSGTNAGDVVNTSGVYSILMNGDKTVSANFTSSPSCQDVLLNATADTYLSGAATTTNYGNAATLQVDGTATAATERTALLRWNVGSIPSNATVITASMAISVSDTSTVGYPMYDVAKPWVEGNGTSGSGATWATYDGSVGWGTAGVNATTGNIDRGTLNLWSATSSSFSSLGLSKVPVTGPGLAVVKRWVTGGSNNGVVILQYSGTSNTLYFDSREGVTPPALVISYCLGAPPAFTVTFDPNGGTGAMSPQTASGPTALTLNTFTRVGYSFSGWNTQPGGGGTAYGDGDIYPFNANATLYAQWTELPLDFGDAPDANYQTLLASNGARHVLGMLVWLGATVDAEANGQPSPLADGDDLNPPPGPDDEDGVTFVQPFLLPGDPAAPIIVQVTGPGVVFLDAWIDFNGNKVFDHPAEHLWGGVSQPVLPGPNPLTFAVPANAMLGPTYARFRLSFAGNLPPFGLAPDGEVEDYQVQIGPTPGTIIVEKQTDPDGATDSFTFTGDAAGTITDGGRIVVSGLQPGTYYAQETVPAGWILTDIMCDDTNSVAHLANFQAEFHLEAGETVTCTFYDLLEMDYGDAPDKYGTLRASNGARHVIIAGHSLGGSVDAEPDGQPSVLADGDDINPAGGPDDEDGVMFQGALVAGNPSALVLVNHGPSGGALDAWIDFNGNGVFDHPAEHLWLGVSQTQGPGSGWIGRPFAVPSDAISGTTYARFRLSIAGYLLPTGLAPDGEVEDYQVQIRLLTLDYAAGTGGHLTGTTHQAVPYGGSGTAVTAVADTGYHFVDWSDGSIDNPRTDTSVTADVSVTANFKQTCYHLSLGHTGNGLDPTASPTNSAGCPDAGLASASAFAPQTNWYVYGENISLSGATPDTGWEITSWTGTISDTSKASTNSVTMPANDHSASVNYVQTCYALTLGHTGNGTTPTASPTNSTGCSAGQYHYLESISLSGATPDTGWGIASWTGTISDTSKASTNTVTMPASAHSAGVNYLRLLGDVNKDGKVDSTDALIVLSADAAIPTTQFCPMNYGDVNGDGLVNSTDALIILSYDAAMSVPFPLGQPRPEPVLSTQPPGCGS